MVEKREYRKAEFGNCEIDSVEFLKGSYNEDAKERILNIIEIEAPITYSLLSKRLINSYGIKRLGSALSELFDSLIKELETEGKLNEQECQGECVFFNSDSSQFFRPTPDDPEEIRYSYQIPVPEALNVIIYIFQRDGKRYKKKDLLEEFSKELEYLRKGAQVVTLFNKAFAEGKEKGIISTSSSGKFYLS